MSGGDEMQHVSMRVLFKVWVLTVDNYNVNRYACTETIFEFTPS